MRIEYLVVQSIGGLRISWWVLYKIVTCACCGLAKFVFNQWNGQDVGFLFWVVAINANISIYLFSHPKGNKQLFHDAPSSSAVIYITHKE